MTTKLTSVQRTAIAKAHQCGMKAGELAIQYDISTGHVCNIRKRYETDHILRAHHNLQQQVRKRTIIDPPPPLEMPEPGPATRFEIDNTARTAVYIKKHIPMCSGQPINHREETRVALAYISIMGRAGV